MDGRCPRRARGARAGVTLVCLTLVMAGCGEASPTGATPAGAPPTGATIAPSPSVVPSPPSPSVAPSPPQASMPVAPPSAAAAECGTVASITGSGSTTGSRALAKYEPPDGYSYFGFAYRLWEGDATWGDTRPFSARICDAVGVELAGKTPTTLWVWAAWFDPADASPVPFSAAKADIDRIHAALGPTVVPFLTWDFGGQENTSKAPITTKDVAAGTYDDYIRRYASDVKDYGQPLFVAPVCFEANGNWWPGCSPKANPKLTRADFVHAWRRVIDIFREQDVTNVAWVWAPVTPLPANQDGSWDSNWKAYYPGDSYVDWIGSSLFEWGQPSWIDPVYSFAVAHAKPYFLTQFGVRGAYTKMTNAQHLKWLTAMLDYVERHPRIKAITYWDYSGNPDKNLDGPGHVWLYDRQVSYVANVNDDDCRLLAGGPRMRSLFADRIAAPRYISAVVTP